MLPSVTILFDPHFLSYHKHYILKSLKFGNLYPKILYRSIFVIHQHHYKLCRLPRLTEYFVEFVICASVAANYLFCKTILQFLLTSSLHVFHWKMLFYSYFGSSTFAEYCNSNSYRIIRLLIYKQPVVLQRVYH